MGDRKIFKDSFGLWVRELQFWVTGSEFWVKTRRKLTKGLLILLCWWLMLTDFCCTKRYCKYHENLDKHRKNHSGKQPKTQHSKPKTAKMMFHDALQAHRFDVVRVILPRYGICVA